MARRLPFPVRDELQDFVGVSNLALFPQVSSLDLELAKKFQIIKKYGLRLSVVGPNLTNHFNPHDVRSDLADPHFGEFFASYRRNFTGGFDILF